MAVVGEKFAVSNLERSQTFALLVYLLEEHEHIASVHAHESVGDGGNLLVVGFPAMVLAQSNLGYILV